MPDGTVKKVFADRGFGFIKPDGGGNDLFFHVKGCQTGIFESLEIGSAVAFEVDDRPDPRGKGPKAFNVRKI